MIKYNNLYKYCCFGLGQHAQAAEIGGKGSHERAIDITFPSRSQNGIKHKYEIFIVFFNNSLSAGMENFNFATNF